MMLLLLASGCSGNYAPSGVNLKPVKRAEFQPLPAEAIQPQKPQVCSPSCTQALTKEREKSRSLLMTLTGRGSGVSKFTTQLQDQRRK